MRDPELARSAIWAVVRAARPALLAALVVFQPMRKSTSTFSASVTPTDADHHKHAKQDHHPADDGPDG